MVHPGVKPFLNRTELISDILLAKIAERMTAKQGFPTHLSLSDQGMFALGYYHQRNDNYRPNDQKIEPVKEKK